VQHPDSPADLFRMPDQCVFSFGLQSPYVIVCVLINGRCSGREGFCQRPFPLLPEEVVFWIAPEAGSLPASLRAWMPWIASRLRSKSGTRHSGQASRRLPGNLHTVRRAHATPWVEGFAVTQSARIVEALRSYVTVKPRHRWRGLGTAVLPVGVHCGPPQPKNLHLQDCLPRSPMVYAIVAAGADSPPVADAASVVAHFRALNHL
jgi:hypothetical protein